MDNMGLPSIVNDYLNYMLTIKGKSKNTVEAYGYDLEIFFKFMKCRKNKLKQTDFDQISIEDIDIEFIKKINLNDLYAFLSYVSNERNNGARARARKVACIRSFYNFYTKTKGHRVQSDIGIRISKNRTTKSSIS